MRGRESESSRLSKFLFSSVVAAAGASDASAPAPPSSDKDLGIGGRKGGTAQGFRIIPTFHRVKNEIG